MCLCGLRHTRHREKFGDYVTIVNQWRLFYREEKILEGFSLNDNQRPLCKVFENREEYVKKKSNCSEKQSLYYFVTPAETTIRSMWLDANSKVFYLLQK